MTIEFAQLNTVVLSCKRFFPFLILTLRLGGVICDLTLKWELIQGSVTQIHLEYFPLGQGWNDMARVLVADPIATEGVELGVQDQRWM
ncbi:MAG: hypothetical protein CM1200mP35_08470 [Chloroflexota bacterium]|nr:MAG: hypothetical protein CM1200mP35_08470 [Chloroflexota bacterium]